jgi:SrtB family sortase
MGAGDPKAISGVELPPQGVTFAPAATTAAPATATPTSRIPQNDPLVGVVDSGGAKPSSVLPTPTPVLRSKRQRYANNALLTENPAFDALRQENKQVVGRLTIDGVLDETVVQYNNTFYLNHNARGVLSATGAVFVDEGCTLKKPPENLLLRAQANAAGKLFSPLLQYETGGTAFLTQHGIVRCDTLYEDAQYVIFAILRADSVVGSADYFNYAGYPTFPSDTLMMNYVAAAKAKSLIKVSVGVRPDDRLLTLATVPEGGDTTSLVILCRMLRTGESAAYVAPE